MKGRLLKRLLSCYLSLFLLLGPFFSVLLYAQESEPSSAEETVVVVQESSPVEEIIETGDAVSVSDGLTEVNQNVNLIEETVTDETTDECSDDCLVVEIENSNQATVAAQVEAEANSGDNSIEVATDSAGLEQAVIDTGQALAVANNAVVVNTNLTGSDFEYSVLTDEDLSGGADFSTNWQEFEEEAGNQNSSAQVVVVANENLADVNLTTVAIANSGNNLIDGAAIGQIETGDSIALANSVAIVNTNFTNSEFLYTVINIFDTLEGDLVFPSPDYFLADSQAVVLSSEIEIINNNKAGVDNQTISSADSGGNLITGNGQLIIETGQAVSVSNVFNWINQNFVGVSFFSLLFNNFGNWDGQLLNWQGAGTVTNLGQGSYLFQFGSQPDESVGVVNQNDCCSALAVENENQATVNTTTTASAVSGDNIISGLGNGEIKTGQALAVANSTSVVNSNFVNSKVFFGIFNLFGLFKGNLVFAYPDLEIEITDNRDEVLPGEELAYVIHYRNSGQAPARNVTIHQQTNPQLNLLSVNSPQPVVNGNDFDWFLEELAPGQEGKITVVMEVAGEAVEDDLVSPIIIESQDQDIDRENNFAQDLTRLVFPDPQPASVPDNDQDNDNTSNDNNNQPELIITSSNNVADFIYPGDSLLFKVVVKNQGDGLAEDVLLFNQLYNQIPDPLDEAGLPIGNLEPGEEKVIEFGYQLPADPTMVHPGTYRLESWLEGSNVAGDLVFSSVSKTYFQVRLKNQTAGLIETVQAAENEQVLGASQACSGSDSEEKLLPYLLLFAMSGLWLVEKGRRFLVN